MAKNNNPGRILKGTKSQPSLKGASGVWTLDEALQYHRANQWPQPNLFQPVSNSLRFKGNSPASYLIHQNSRPGSNTTGTISFWTKLGASSNDQHFFQTVDAIGGSSGANRLYMAFTTGTGTMYIYGQDGSGSQDIYFVTTQAFRDFGAWYHIVVAIDSTQSTQANRFKLYVNGVQVTGFSTASYPAQGAVIAFSNNATTIIGCNRGPSLPYVGEMSEFYFIDGYALQPTLFGQFDTNNTWVPVPYTGSYGTNGFYLPFTNATTSQTLGYDASLNGTTTYNADQDPYRGSVVLHLTGNGPAGGQNNSFADSSTNNYKITATGTTAQGSFSPFPFNTTSSYNPAVHGGSSYVGVASSYLSLPASTPLYLNTATWTVEFWMYPTSYVNGQGVFGASNGGGAQPKVAWQVNGASNISLYVNGSPVVTTTLPTLNVWTHVVVTAYSGTAYVYYNGAQQSSGAISTQTGLTSNFQLFTNGEGATSGMYGYLSSFVVYNVAKYTASFIPMMRPFGALTNNQQPFSEDFTQSVYAKDRSSVVTGAAIAPDGTPTASKLVEDTTASNTHRWYFNQYTFTNAVSYTHSIYLKAGERTGAALGIWNGTTEIYCLVDLTNGSIAAGSSGTATVTSVGNGWYRCSVTHVGTGASGCGGTLYISNTSPPSGGNAYTGNGVSGLYMWGDQIDVGSTMNNYTPTPANYSTAPSLLLNFANAAVVDSAGATNVVTTGAATLTSSSKYGSGAVVLTNTGASQTDYLNISNANCYFPGDFTVEFWFNPQSISTSWTDFAAILDLSASVSTDTSWWVIHQVNQTLQWYTNGGALVNGQTTTLITGNVLTTANTWYHVALVRSQNNLSFYVNGQVAATISNTLAFGSQRALTVGAQNSSSTRFTRGSIDDLRITKGLARYTSNFTPPARALPETGGKSFATVNVNAGVVKSFTTTGTTSWTAPTDVTQVEVLVVAGGGGGGCNNGGGGGGGGVVYNNSYPVTPGQTYTVTVGAGGTPNTSSSGFTSQGNTGSNSQFGNLTAIGGGGGGGQGGSGAGGDGKTGGSGGGTGNMNSGGGTVGFGTAGQGFNGGLAAAGSYSQAAGGGGAGQLGFSFGGGTAAAGAGGAGLQFGISGTPTYYAGGGGGASSPGSAGQGAGGIGGGGAGVAGNGVSGTANTGGGGGGCTNAATGGTGGSGIVLIRYTTTAVANTSDATTDNLVDSPTLYGHDYGNGGEVVGNYATLNPLGQALSGATTLNIQNGGLTAGAPTAGTAGYGIYTSTIAAPATGYWYAEFAVSGTYTSANNNSVGLISTVVTTLSNFIGSAANTYCYFDGDKITGTFRSNSATAQSIPGFTSGDTLMVALGNGNLWFGKNGLWLGTGSPNPATATSPAYTGLSGNYYFACGNYTAPYGYVFNANFGQRAWAYTPPQGFNALTTKNLPRPVVGSAAATPNQFFDAVTYTGTGAAQTITLPGAFKPDLVWVKARANPGTHQNLLHDSVRGITTWLISNSTGAEATDGTSFSSFNSDGFTLGTGGNGHNISAETYVAWCWKAGGAAVANTAGTITSQVSANTTAGFSVVTYTGTGTTTATVGHGLGATPAMVITKVRNAVDNWRVWHQGLFQGIDSTGYMLTLNTTGVAGYDSQRCTGGDASTFRIIGNSVPYINGAGNTYVAYVWSEVPGFSKFGSWTNNNSNDGTFVYLGFKPAFVMLKNTDNTETWYITDGKRHTYNVGPGADSTFLVPNSSGAEGAGNATTATVDLLSNGFKIRTTNPASGEISFGTRNYIYAAFAEKPFGNANGTAR